MRPRLRHLAAQKAWRTRKRGGPHARVIRSLKELAKGYPGYQTDKIHSEEQFPRPALIPLGKRHFSIYYVPDLWAKTKVGTQFDVYEVWDSQDRDKAFFEVFRVGFTPEVRYYHVVCINGETGDWTKKEVENLVRGVLDNLKDPGISYNDVSIAEVGTSILYSDSSLRSALTRQLGF